VSLLDDPISAYVGEMLSVELLVNGDGRFSDVISVEPSDVAGVSTLTSSDKGDAAWSLVSSVRSKPHNGILLRSGDDFFWSFFSKISRA